MMLKNRQKRLKTRAALKTYLIRNQTVALLLLLGITSCTSGPIPKWDGKLWAGDSKNAGITRSQESDPAQKTIKANDPRFDDYVAMSYGDFRLFMATYVYGCKTWKPGIKLMGADEAMLKFKIILDEWQAESTK
jgi:hypothetical protein